jgi:hypothetical protein
VVTAILFYGNNPQYLSPSAVFSKSLCRDFEKTIFKLGASHELTRDAGPEPEHPCVCQKRQADCLGRRNGRPVQAFQHLLV